MSTNKTQIDQRSFGGPSIKTTRLGEHVNITEDMLGSSWTHVPSGWKCEVSYRYPTQIRVTVPKTTPLGRQFIDAGKRGDLFKCERLRREVKNFIEAKAHLIQGARNWKGILVFTATIHRCTVHELHSACNQLANRLYARYGEDLWPK